MVVVIVIVLCRCLQHGTIRQSDLLNNKVYFTLNFHKESDMPTQSIMFLAASYHVAFATSNFNLHRVC